MPCRHRLFIVSPYIVGAPSPDNPHHAPRQPPRLPRLATQPPVSPTPAYGLPCRSHVPSEPRALL